MNKKMHEIGNNVFWRLFDWNGTMIMKIVSNLKKKSIKIILDWGLKNLQEEKVEENMPILS